MKIEELDPRILEALVLVTEEASEVIKEVQKTFRSCPAFCPYDGLATNLDNVKTELIDLQVVLDKAFELLQMYPGSDSFESAKNRKLDKLRRWSNIFGL